MQPDGRCEEAGGSREGGLTCGWCHKTIDRPTQEQAEKDADALGWRYTLDALGQAHVTCPDCIGIGYYPIRFIVDDKCKKQ